MFGARDRDDGHTIADMSALRGEPAEVSESARGISEELQSEEERLMVILGTMKAALSLGMVYVVVFGIAIAIMVWAWA